MTTTHDDSEVHVEVELEDADRELTSTVVLFEGDEGRLEIGQRRALVALLKHRFITARTHPAEWRALVAAPDLARSRLNDLFLDLHLDLRREVAFKRQAVPDGGGRFPTLLFDTAWSREETILMVYLRSRSRAEEASGVTRVYVDREEMLDHVASLRPDHATDQASDVKRAGNAVENLTKAGLLIGPRGGDRFEVSPAIDVVLPLERLQELLRWLQEQNTPDGVQDVIDDEADDVPAAVPTDDEATEEQL
ncbi:DUF4194 domain-containing protein [Kineosporia sp. A_224]|uniref:DUF4194 domain-containing protein n=1 Tax=Kineosporia sp. A_224 TaxID=1962180 RepID=UPI000B4B43CC|nr:DUF4194 domain-containing protein [Kineosporia sp. A_224]